MTQFVKFKHSGFTLVEMMIALTLGLVIMLVIGTIFVSSSETFRVQEDNARIQESGRFALEVIGRSIKQAGSADIPFTGFKVAFTGTAIDGADGGVGIADTLITQHDGVVGESDCEGTLVTATGNIIQNYFNVDAANAQLRCDGEISAVPAVPGVAPLGIVLVENVEDLQVLYGIDTVGDQSANQYVNTPVNWEQVVTARVCVLVRSDKTNIATVGRNYLDCNGALAVVPADGRLRHPFSATFNLRNRINIIP